MLNQHFNVYISVQQENFYLWHVGHHSAARDESKPVLQPMATSPGAQIIIIQGCKQDLHI